MGESKAAAAKPGPEWVRLGELLQARRGELGHKYRTTLIDQNETLARSARTLLQIEKGQRTNYSESMLGAIEAAYEWEPGSIRDVLAGGDPTPRRPVMVEVDEMSRARLEAYRLIDKLSRAGLDTAVRFLRWLRVEDQRESE